MGQIQQRSMADVSKVWLDFVTWAGPSDRLIFVLGMYLVSELWYLAIASFYYALWHYDLLLPYRIQKKASMPSADMIKRCIEDVTLRSALARLPFLFVLYDVFVYFGMTIRGPLPSLPTILNHWFIALILNDTMFYWVHRTLHHRWLYRIFHKKHHEFKVNVSVNSEYAEMTEIVLCDVIPTIGGCMLMGSHFLVMLGWIAIRVWETCAAHSGYALPWCPWSQFAIFNGPQMHDFHHSHNVGTFGAMTRFWDWIMGTDSHYQEFASTNIDPDIPNKSMSWCFKPPVGE